MKISVILEALTGLFETDLNRAAKTSEKRMKEIRANAQKMGKEIGIALAGAATTLGVAVKLAIDRADELSKAAQKIGIPTAELSKLAYAADLSDVSLETLQTGVKKLVTNMSDAARGNKEAAAMFDAFGIAVKDSNGELRDAQSVILQFADVFKALPDGAEKTALAVKLFGKSGQELIPLLNGGSEAIKQSGDELERFGGVVDGATGKAAEDFNDTLTRIKTVAEGLSLQIAKALLPQMQDLASSFLDVAKSKDTFNDLKDGFDVIILAGKLVVLAVQAVVDTVQALTSAVISNAKALEGLYKISHGDFSGGAEAFKASFREFQAGGAAFKETGQRFNSIFGDSPDKKPAAPYVSQTTGPKSRSGAAERQAAAVRAAAAKLLAEQDKSAEEAAKRKAAADKAAREAARKRAEAEKELSDRLADQAKASADLKTLTEDLQAKQDGPLAQLTLDYNRQTDAVKKLADTAEKDATPALELLRKQYEKDKKAIEEQQTPLDALLDDMRFELDLLGRTNAERVVANNLRYVAAGLSEEEKKNAAEQLTALEQEYEARQRNISALDEFRSNFEDNVASVLDGSKSMADAFKSFADAVIAQIARIIAQNLTASLFGQPGQSGGGGLGGILSSVFSIFTGGGSSVPMPSDGGAAALGFHDLFHFGSGTNSAPGGWAMVGENGPELVNLPKGSQVVPTHKLGGMGGFTQIVNNNFAAPNDPRTQDQIAARQGFVTNRALARMGA